MDMSCFYPLAIERSVALNMHIQFLCASVFSSVGSAPRKSRTSTFTAFCRLSHLRIVQIQAENIYPTSQWKSIKEFFSHSFKLPRKSAEISRSRRNAASPAEVVTAIALPGCILLCVFMKQSPWCLFVVVLVTSSALFPIFP